MMLKEAAAADREYAILLEARIRNISKSEIKDGESMGQFRIVTRRVTVNI